VTLDRFQAADNTPTSSSRCLGPPLRSLPTSLPLQLPGSPRDNEQSRPAKSRKTGASACLRRLHSSRRLATARRHGAPLCLHCVISLSFISPRSVNYEFPRNTCGIVQRGYTSRSANGAVQVGYARKKSLRSGKKAFPRTLTELIPHDKMRRGKRSFSGRAWEMPRCPGGGRLP
jgi:hypothetical protein